MKYIEQLVNWILGESDNSPRVKVVDSDNKNVYEDYSHAEAVTPADGSNLPVTPTKALYVGGNGDIKVDMEDENTVTFIGVTAGSIYKLRVKRVYSTDTTATDIVALY